MLFVIVLWIIWGVRKRAVDGMHLTTDLQELSGIIQSSARVIV